MRQRVRSGDTHPGAQVGRCGFTPGGGIPPGRSALYRRTGGRLTESGIPRLGVGCEPSTPVHQSRSGGHGHPMLALSRSDHRGVVTPPNTRVSGRTPDWQTPVTSVCHFALLAQGIEHPATDRKAGGSNPPRGTFPRVVSSADRAPVSGTGGQGFESLTAHVDDFHRVLRSRWIRVLCGMYSRRDGRVKPV